MVAPEMRLSFIRLVPPKVTSLAQVSVPILAAEPGATVEVLAVVTMPVTVPKPLKVWPAFNDSV